MDKYKVTHLIMKHFFGKALFRKTVDKIKRQPQRNINNPHKQLNSDLYFLKRKNLFLKDSL